MQSRKTGGTTGRMQRRRKGPTAAHGRDGSGRSAKATAAGRIRAGAKG